MTPKQIEHRRLEVQATLDAAKTAMERNELGQFATPPDLAEGIVREALKFLPPKQPIRFLDPTIGTGSFFSALLRTVKKSRIDSALGVELDVAFARAAKNLWSAEGLKVVVGDFSQVAVPPEERRPNLVVANPPYIRHHHLRSEDKTRLLRTTERRTGLTVSGLAGLYVHLLLSSCAWMGDDCVAAWLIPSEWMSVNYGSVLQQFLLQNVELLRVHVFDAADVQFGDALVSSSVVFFRSGAGRSKTVRFTTGPLEKPKFERNVTREALAKTKKWSPFLQIARTTSLVLRRIGDLFEIRRGIATGSNGFFVRRRSEFLTKGIPARFLRPILPSSRKLEGTTIEAGDDGFPLSLDPLALLDCDVIPECLRRDYPQTWQYFNSEEAEESKLGYLTSKRFPWYLQERRAPAPFVCTYMGRGRASSDSLPFRVFWNRSRAIATNGYLMLYPRQQLALVLAADATLGGRVAELLLKAIAESYQERGRVYGGGLHKLEPKELASIPANELFELISQTDLCATTDEMALAI